MKKLFALILAVAMLASMATVVSAAENETTKTTTLTTTVPAATYTLNVPEDQKIEFGDTEKTIGNVTVTEAKGFAVGKNLKVTIDYTELTCKDVSTTIPIALYQYDTGDFTKQIKSGDSLAFLGKDDGTVYSKAFVEKYNHQSLYVDSISVRISSADWGKALAGTYTSTITYKAEVVVDE